jgi:hypothetical protein
MTYVHKEKLKAIERKTKTHQSIIVNPLPCKEYNSYGHLQMGRQPMLLITLRLNNQKRN